MVAAREITGLATEAAPAAQRLIPAWELVTRRVTAGKGSYRGITQSVRQWAREVYARHGGTGPMDVAHIESHVFTEPGQSVLVRPQARAINRAEGRSISEAAAARRELSASTPDSPLKVR
jgi:hypothetical protein